MNKIWQNKKVIKVERWMEIKYNNDIRRLQYMTIEDIKQLIADDEHRTLELKKTTGELKDGMMVMR